MLCFDSNGQLRGGVVTTPTLGAGSCTVSINLINYFRLNEGTLRINNVPVVAREIEMAVIIDELGASNQK